MHEKKTMSCPSGPVGAHLGGLPGLPLGPTTFTLLVDDQGTLVFVAAALGLGLLLGAGLGLPIRQAFLLFCLSGEKMFMYATYRLQVTGYSFGRRFYPKRLTSSANNRDIGPHATYTFKKHVFHFSMFHLILRYN